MSIFRLCAAAISVGALSFPAAAQDCEAHRAAVADHAATFSEMVAGAQAMLDTLGAVTADRALSPAVGDRIMRDGSLPLTSAILSSQARLEAAVAELAAACPD